MFLFSGAIFSFIWGIGILVRDNTREDNWLVSSFLAIGGVWLLSGAYIISGYYKTNPDYYLLHFPFVYLCGPILYKYYNKILLEADIPLRKFTNHFIVPAVVILCIFPFHIKTHNEKIHFIHEALSGNGGDYHLLLYVINTGSKISILSYFTILLWKNRIVFLNIIKSKETEKILILLIISLLYADLLIGLIGFFIKNFFLVKLSSLILPFNLFFFFILSHKYPGIVTGLSYEIKKVKYGQSKIESLNIEEIITKLQDLMNKEKAYSDEDISLPSLSEELGISTHQLSQILNERLNKNFYQYINEHRIEEAKKIILDEPERSILSIGFAVGFNSKSAFNKAFKSFTGITPIEYRKKYS